MLRVKVARRYKRLSALFFAILGFIWLGFVGFTIVVIDDVAIQTGAAFVSFVIFVVAVLWMARRREQNFRCLDCGGEVEPCIEVEGKGGEPLLRLCKRCDVLWHVGTSPYPG